MRVEKRLVSSWLDRKLTESFHTWAFCGLTRIKQGGQHEKNVNVSGEGILGGQQTRRGAASGVESQS